MRSGIRHPIHGARYRLGVQKGQGIPKRWLRPYLRKDAVIVEAGAHRGEDTLQFSRMWSKGHVHAFEPVPEVHALLCQTLGDRRNVSTYQLALADEEGTRTIWRSDPDGSNSLYRPAAHVESEHGITHERGEAVPVTTLATWAERAGVIRVDAMWLDMQGAELATLKGAGRLLDTTRALVLEVSFVELYESTPLWPEVREWLEARGFRIEAVKPEHETFGNALAVRS